MITRETSVSGAASVGAVERAPLAAAAAGYVSLYLVTELVVPNLASSSLPAPDAPAADVRAWYAENPLVVATVGAALIDAAGCLGWFVSGFTRANGRTAVQSAAAHRASAWGFAAMALLIGSSALDWLLAVVAEDAPLSMVAALRTTADVAGGAAHVLALGVFVLLAARIPGASPQLRMLGYVAASAAVAASASTAVIGAAPIVVVGHLLCMLWILTAAVGVRRAQTAVSR